MEFGICLISVVPVRAFPDDTTEQVTQLLFGDMVRVLEKKKKWVLVEIVADDYQGWVSDGQLELISENDFLSLRDAPTHTSNDLVQVLENKSRQINFVVSAGSSFYNCREGHFDLLGDEYHFWGSMLKSDDFEPQGIVNHALLFLNVPYQWGGKSALGMDCSGLNQVVYKMAGKKILRDASQQATQGETIHLISEARPGDLLFFDNEEGIITHTGILADESHIIHAHHIVRMDKVDHHGIFNAQKGKYTHQLRIIKRIHS